MVWTLDLKNGSGSLTKGKNGKADATFALTDQDAVDLFDKKLNPQTAFMQGKMKIKGNMGAAQKFTPDTFPQTSKLWSLKVLKSYLICNIIFLKLKKIEDVP